MSSIDNYDGPIMIAYNLQETEFLQNALTARVSVYKTKWVMRLVLSPRVLWHMNVACMQTNGNSSVFGVKQAM